MCRIRFSYGREGGGSHLSWSNRDVITVVVTGAAGWWVLNQVVSRLPDLHISVDVPAAYVLGLVVAIAVMMRRR